MWQCLSPLTVIEFPMPKKLDPLAALRKLLTEPGSLDDVWDDLLGSATDDPKKRVLRAMSRGKGYDDISAVLVFTAMLDQFLQGAIASVLYSKPQRTKLLFAYDHKEGGGVLSSFAAKIKMGNSLGLYCDNMLKDLEVIKLIRNVFAHAQVHVDFDNAAVNDACNVILLAENIAKRDWRIGHQGHMKVIKIDTSRQRFTSSVAMMAHYLSLYQHLELSHPMIPTIYAKMYGVALPLLQKQSWPS